MAKAKKSKRKLPKSWLKCPYCRDTFLVGRSYSNHITRCPAFALTTTTTTSSHLLPAVFSLQPQSSAATAPALSLSPTATFLDDNDDDSAMASNNTRASDKDSNNSTSSDDDELSVASNVVKAGPNSNSADPRYLLQHHFLSYFTSTDETGQPVPQPPSLPLSTTAVNDNHPEDSGATTKALFTPTQCHTLDDAVHLRLMNLCHELRAPMYAFDSILKWAQESNLSGYHFPTDAPSRKTYLGSLYSQFNMRNTLPIETEITLHPDKKANVITFSFTEMVHSLLSDEKLMNPANLLLHPSDPSICEDINSGSWYHSAFQNLCTIPSDILCAIILFIDKTQIDQLSKWSLEPVLFTLGIFNRSTRNLSQAWRPLGLVTNTIRMSSATRAGVGKQGNNLQNYHRMLDVILSDLVKCQLSGGIATKLVLNNHLTPVTLKVPVAFVVGDCEGNDKLCGRFGTHQLGNSLVCRDCDCPTLSADNPNVRCSPLLLQTIREARGDLEALQQLSHHNIDNAFHKLCFGGDAQGIHGCSPPEMLHLYQQGLYKYALEAFVNTLTSEQQRYLDQLISKVSDSCYHQSDRTFPRFRFPRGITNLSCFTAAEQVGVTIVCFLAIAMQDFQTIILFYNKSKKNYQVDTAAFERCKSFKKLFESMLIAESWINKESHSKTQVRDLAPTAIARLMSQYKTTVNRTEGNGLKIPKFHQLKHFPRYILKFGSPANFSTSRCESHHIQLSKKPARTAQKRDDCFEKQVGQRIVDTIVLSRATQALVSLTPQPSSLSTKQAIGGTHFSIVQLGGDENFTAVPYTTSSPPLPFASVLLNKFGNALADHYPAHEGIKQYRD